ncbi:MAG: crossover junction endodeoxyribonuclease RuvC [Proteobacteria bacterium]|nr:crossover junction endodeoxyribonuclease RuvC [Desulfobacula sp.]MBU3950512.1 crossover junction endodeoxyribonuclease RuvC [Pseudomonadota bacterium]MBU4131677.1 crossover junction endodeoxyribonuclease RuvC [Pseudomonadota bacterium]
MVKIVGIDPGLAGTGIGVVQGDGRDISEYSFGSIATDPNASIPSRLNLIYSKVADFLGEQKPDLVVIEDIYSLEKYPGSGIMLGKVSGVLLVASFRAGVRVEEISVREAKKIITGNGSADKFQVEKSVRSLLKHSVPIRPFHASDALGLALTGYFRYGKEL